MLDDLVADEERTVEKSTQHERLMHSSNKPTDSMEK